MKKLTNKEYWNERWGGVNKKNKIIKKIKKMFGSYIDSYADFLQWEKIYEKYLEKKEGKLLEIGSAPGSNLIKFKNKYNFEVYGVEFSDVGAEENRKRFIANNIKPNRIIEADFFDNSFQEKYKNYFNYVMSGGFIEHFDDVEKVIDQHLKLLKNNGTLIITIPNFQGINYFLSNFFHKDVMKTHNFSIMNLIKFKKLFENKGLSEKYCNYFGTLYFGLYVYDYNNKVYKKIIFRILIRIQQLLNIFFRIIFGKKGFENKYTSPYLIYIGKKHENREC